jgi:hypothetical protein
MLINLIILNILNNFKKFVLYIFLYIYFYIFFKTIIFIILLALFPVPRWAAGDLAGCCESIAAGV